VSKGRLLKDVRQATTPEDAQTCEGMKKADMAARAEKLVAGKGMAAGNATPRSRGLEPLSDAPI
jgi:hypothetical protein